MANVLLHTLAAAETTHPLPFDPAVFGLISMGTFLALLALTWSFRNTGHKHR